MADEKLSNETQELFTAEIEHSSYNSVTQIKSKKSVAITTKRVKNTIEVYLHNKNIYDLTIKVKHNVKNIIMSIKPHKEFVLEAKATSSGKRKTISTKFSTLNGILENPIKAI